MPKQSRERYHKGKNILATLQRTVQAEDALFVKILQVGFIKKIEVFGNNWFIKRGEQEVDLYAKQCFEKKMHTHGKA